MSSSTVENSDSYMPSIERSHDLDSRDGIVDVPTPSTTANMRNRPMPTPAVLPIPCDARGCTFNDVGGHQYIIHPSQPVSVPNEALVSLKPVDRSGYYVPPCMEGTRENILKKIDQWLDDVNAPNVLWLNGCPGVGKSAIASSLISRLTDRRRLGSSFFFKRGDIMLSDPAAVWRTIAYDLAQHSTTFADNLVEILKGRTILHKRPDVALHFKFLIEIPLTKSYDKSSSRDVPVIVIDALDECNSEGPRGAQKRHFLHTLTQWSRLSHTFKLVITGRDERIIPESFRDICMQMALPTGDSVSNDANEDIRRFFEERFANIRDSLSPRWKWKRVLDVLTTRAAGLFIWAETVVKFVDQGLPVERLELALKGDLGGGNDITKLYQQVLQLSFTEAKGRTLEVFRLVVGAIVLAKGHIRCSDLQQLVQEEDSSVKFILDKLSSVIFVVDPDESIQIGHLSFSEFLCDRERCPPEFFINRDQQSQKLALSCFRLMKHGLKFNICDLKTSHLLNDEVEDLSQKTETHISTALLYSCRFWAAHLRGAKFQSDIHTAVIEEIKDFLYVRLLFWLEVMSLKKEVSAANVALLTLAYWIQGFDKKLAYIAQDCSRFVVNFFMPISRSTPHIYISALPFSPLECFVGKQYRPLFPNTLSILSGADENWPAVINVFRGHARSVYCISFSPDGKRLASGSGDHTIRIWDSQTGDTVAGPFEGHTEQVWCVAFSPDGKMVASGSGDYTIRLWDSCTGETVKGPFDCHAIVWSVAFSPDGRRLASGSANEIICIWDTATGEIVAGPFKGHTGPIWSVAFSPDGKTVASGSGDQTVRIWDSVTGETVAGPFEDHTEQVWSVAFSPDGKTVASGSGDQTVRIWDAMTGKKVMGPFTGQTSVWSVAFSPDGRRVASGSADEIIHIWDLETGDAVTDPLEGHTGSVWSVAFSPDGKIVASGSEDHTIRLSYSGTASGDLEGKITPPSSGTVSPDNHSVASSSCNCMVRVLDAKTGHIMAGPFEGHTDVVFSVTPSLDDKHATSGFRDVKLHFWNAETNLVSASPFRNEVGFLELPKGSDGWIFCSDMMSYEVGAGGHLFWVPKTCREALCGVDTLIVLGKRTTRLDLHRFVHGTSWTRCYCPRGASREETSVGSFSITTNSFGFDIYSLFTKYCFHTRPFRCGLLFPPHHS